MDEEFDELYKQLRGSRCASMVLDARVKFLDGDLTDAAKILDSVQETFKELRWSTLNQAADIPDPKQRAALDKDTRMQIRRKEKTFETLEQLNALQASLQKQIARQQRKSPTAPATTETAATAVPPRPVAPPASVSPSFEKESLSAPVPKTAPVSSTTLPPSTPTETAPPVAAKTPPLPPRTAPVAELPEALISKLGRETGPPERLLILGDFFDFGFIDDNHSVSVGAYYFVAVSSEHNFFVVAGDPPIIDESVNLFLAVEGQKIKPFALTKFRTYGRDGKITWLKPKKPNLKSTQSPNGDRVATKPAIVEPAPSPDQSNEPFTSKFVDSDSQQADATEEIAGGLDAAERDTILDMGAFSQLAEAAQRTGIVPGVSTIIQLRDCEFRLGRYQQALQTMEGLFGAFTGAAQQRTQRLAREDAEIASGKLKISPKDLQAKRIRDKTTNDAIDRARGRFMRVLDGLRLVIHRANELQSQHSGKE